MLTRTSYDPVTRRQPPAEEAALIRMCGLHKSFGPLRVLQGLDLDLRRGEVTVIIGRSGTGKSVLLKHIVGLLRPDRGEVWFDGRRIDDLSERDLVDVRRKVGYLFQMGALFDSMNVAENVTFPLKQQGRIRKKEMAERCAEVLRTVGLEGLEKKMPGELSGGQKKRVALARAVILEPQVVLYDEPTTGLDPIRSDLINELIISLSERLGVTSVVVTHDMASAFKIADRMVMLEGGQVLADGTPEDFRNSEEPVVYRFVHGEADPDELAAIRGESPSQKSPPHVPQGPP